MGLLASRFGRWVQVTQNGKEPQWFFHYYSFHYNHNGRCHRCFFRISLTAASMSACRSIILTIKYRNCNFRDSAESMCGRILAAFTRVSPKAKEGTTRFAKFFRGNGVFRDCDQILLCTKPGPLERRTLEGFRGTVVIRDSTESQVRDTDKPARPSGAPDPSWVLRNGSHSATRPNLWCTTINRPPLGARTLEGFRETAVIRDSAGSLCATENRPAHLGRRTLRGFSIRRLS